MKLFKLNSNKSIQTWEIFSTNTGYYTVHGQDGGKQIVSEETKVVAKANRLFDEQLQNEVAAKIQKQKDKGYVENISDVLKTGLPAFQCMLAKKWEDHKHKIVYPCSVQPKIDGSRCLATSYGLFSRNRKPYDSCYHIWKELQGHFDKFPDDKLDGEFYAHTFKSDFELLMSAVKTTSKHITPEKLRFQQKVCYYIFDAHTICRMGPDVPFEDRMRKIIEVFGRGYEHIKTVWTHFNVFSEKEIIELQERFITEGYEGAMIRNKGMLYEGKRTDTLLKFKNFQDEEFQIIGIVEGKGNLSGCAASFTMLTKDCKQFDGKLVGSIERLRDIFKDPSLVVGKMATVRFQNLTADGIPRFPVVKNVIDFSY